MCSFLLTLLTLCTVWHGLQLTLVFKTISLACILRLLIDFISLGQDFLGDCLFYWCCKYIITLPVFQVDQWNICIICIPRKWRMETNLSKEESVYKQHCIFPTINCSTAVPCPLCRCQRSEIQDRNNSWGFGVLCGSMHSWTPLEGTLSRALTECHEELSIFPVVQIHISFSVFHCIQIVPWLT